MKAICISSVIIGLMVSVPANAINFKNYKEIVSKGGGMYDAMAFHYSGLETGLEIANAQLVFQKMKPLFCQPADVVISKDHVMNMLATSIGYATAKNVLTDTTSVDEFVLLGMQAAYPCPK